MITIIKETISLVRLTPIAKSNEFSQTIPLPVVPLIKTGNALITSNG